MPNPASHRPGGGGRGGGRDLSPSRSCYKLDLKIQLVCIQLHVWYFFLQNKTIYQAWGICFLNRLCMPAHFIFGFHHFHIESEVILKFLLNSKQSVKTFVTKSFFKSVAYGHGVILFYLSWILKTNAPWIG